MQKRKRGIKLLSSQKPNPITIDRTDQYLAIGSPVRDQILQVVVNQAGRRDGEQPDEHGVSIFDIAHQIGRKPGSLYRHIDELVNAGLIEPAGAHLTGGRDATGYIAQGDVAYLRVPRDREGLEAMCRYIERSAALAGKEVALATRAIAAKKPDDCVNDPEISKDHAMLAMFGWLDPDQQLELREHMQSIAQLFAQSERREGTKLIATNLQIRPVVLPGGNTACESNGP